MRYNPLICSLNYKPVKSFILDSSELKKLVGTNPETGENKKYSFVDFSNLVGKMEIFCLNYMTGQTDFFHEGDEMLILDGQLYGIKNTIY